MARLILAQPKFKILVANIEGAGDPSRGRNPVKVRTGFEKQNLPELARGDVPTRVLDPHTPGVHTHQGLLSYTAPPVSDWTSEVTLLVASNVFTSAATLYLGDYVLTSNEDFTPGGTTDLTATALGAVIDALPDFSATVLASTITIKGPFGVNGNNQRFSAVYRGTVRNYTLTPTDGFLTGGEPVLGPPTIL
jgi:hypothetical protein